MRGYIYFTHTVPNLHFLSKKSTFKKNLHSIQEYCLNWSIQEFDAKIQSKIEFLDKNSISK